MASDALFLSLPRNTQEKICLAFDSVAKRIINPVEIPAPGGFLPESGGFLRDEQDDNLQGGFVPEDGGGFIRDDVNPGTASAYIPLSMIPSALQFLDLPPDDEEVLAVFRNAATGWALSANGVDAPNIEREEHVSRDDWCSVCAVLLEHNIGEGANVDNDVEMVAGSGRRSDNDSDTDEYRESEPEDEDEDDEDVDDDEYMEGPSTSVARRRLRQRGKSSSSSPPPLSTLPDTKSHKLTPRQRQVCTDAYALFFPSSPPDELLNQRIMIKDIQRAAKLLNEKLKAEEMLEMLETFSTSPDKSMSFDDFCRMMVSSKLA